MIKLGRARGPEFSRLSEERIPRLLPFTLSAMASDRTYRGPLDIFKAAFGSVQTVEEIAGLLRLNVASRDR